jgi:hypothetical protein
MLVLFALCLAIRCYSFPRQYLKCFGLQSMRGRAQPDLTLLKKLPPSRPSWIEAGGNKHILEPLRRQKLYNKAQFSVTRCEDTGLIPHLL